MTFQARGICYQKASDHGDEKWVVLWFIQRKFFIPHLSHPHFSAESARSKIVSAFQISRHLVLPLFVKGRSSFLHMLAQSHDRIWLGLAGCMRPVCVCVWEKENQSSRCCSFANSLFYALISSSSLFRRAEVNIYCGISFSHIFFTFKDVKTLFL